jgi:succinyl-diaminopimelate desuccinylase
MAVPDPVELAQALIRCPSVTPRNEGVMEVLAGVLQSAGFQVWRPVFAEGDEQPVENLYARYGTASPNLCFAGHLDVVPVGDERAWEMPPFGAEIKGKYLYGRGAEDMKSAIAAFASAAIRVVGKYPALAGSISFLITLDEEGPALSGTRKMIPWLKEQGQVLDHCIVGEPTNPDFLGEMAKIGRRGSLNGRLTVKGKQGHVAYPERAKNPVAHLVNILHRLKAEPIDSGTEYFPPSNLEVTSVDVGNPTHNMIPAQASALFNVRFNDSRPVGRIKDWIQHVCEDEGTAFELQFTVTGEAFHTTPDRLTDKLLDAAEKVTGHRPVLSTTGGTSDARFIKDICPVIEFGTTGRTAHQVDEHVAVEDIRQLAEIYYQTLCGYFALPIEF